MLAEDKHLEEQLWSDELDLLAAQENTRDHYMQEPKDSEAERECGLEDQEAGNRDLQSDCRHVGAEQQRFQEKLEWLQK